MAGAGLWWRSGSGCGAGHSAIGLAAEGNSLAVLLHLGHHRGGSVELTAVRDRLSVHRFVGHHLLNLVQVWLLGETGQFSFSVLAIREGAL